MESDNVSILKDEQLSDLFIKSFDEAANSLSQLIKKDMAIYSSKVELLSGEDFVNQIENGLDQLYIGSIVKVIGEPSTSIVFIISEKDGLGLYDTIFENNVGTTKHVSEEVVSGIGEVNNILGGAFINNLANFLKKEISPSTPINNYDMLGAILDGVILQEEFLDKKILCGDTIIKENEHEEFHTRFFIMTDKEELMRLMKKL